MLEPAKPIEGIINLNKPRGISSARAVSTVKKRLPRGAKIGHAGTLDPFATGVLLLLVGKATKSCERLMDQPKQYLTTVKLGGTTPTDDPESPETPTPGAEPVPAQRVEEAIKMFVGEILQRPPTYSAMKVGGRRAYDIARRGGEVELKPRPVTIYEIEILDYHWPFVKLRIDCGRGTYIRAIGRDLGELLECGGHLTELARTRVGNHTIENAVTLEQIAQGPIEPFLIQMPN
jgi:tRNA pseudouridine55 synthase